MKLLLNTGIKSNYSKSSEGSFASSDSMAAETCTDIVLDNSSSTGQKLQQHAVGAVPALSSLVKTSCLLVAMDANNSKELSVSGLIYALQHVVGKGDVLKLLGIITYIRHALGYKCRVEENHHAWLGANPRHLEDELAFRKQMLLDIPHLDALCAQASVVQIDVEVLPGSRPQVLIVKEAQEMEAHHVVLDHKSLKNRSMRKYYVDNPSCCVTRIRSRAGSRVDVVRSIRSLTTVLPPGFSLVSPKSPRRPETDPEALALVSSRTRFLAEDPYKSSMFSSSASVASSQGSEAKKGLHAAQDISSFTSSTTEPYDIDDQIFINAQVPSEAELGYDSNDLFNIIMHDSFFDTNNYRTSFAGFPLPATLPALNPELHADSKVNLLQSSATRDQVGTIYRRSDP
jgi:hypothetical protein